MKLIPLTKGQFSQVDDGDFEELNKYKWNAHRGKTDNTYYAVRTEYVNSKKVCIIMHRFIMGAKHGQMVDHIDGNGSNNQRNNLRFCTPSQNQANCKRRSKLNCESKYIGVSKKDKSWRATLTYNKRAIHIGCFKTQEQAAIAYNKKAIELHGEFARLNVIA